MVAGAVEAMVGAVGVPAGVQWAVVDPLRQGIHLHRPVGTGLGTGLQVLLLGTGAEAAGPMDSGELLAADPMGSGASAGPMRHPVGFLDTVAADPKPHLLRQATGEPSELVVPTVVEGSVHPRKAVAGPI